MEFETEEQQAEAVKKWFKEYGLTIVLGLVIGLGGVFGYRHYESEQELGYMQATAAYNEVLESIGDKEAFATNVVDYINEHGANVYSNLLVLQQAKFAIDEKDLPKAESLLANVMSTASHTIVEHTARIRLVRVMIAQEKYEQALTTIAGASGDAYNYSYELLRGDVWLARGDKEKAKDAYEKAKSLSEQSPVHPDLDILLAELAAVGGSTASLSGEENE